MRKPSVTLNLGETPGPLVSNLVCCLVGRLVGLSCFVPSHKRLLDKSLLLQFILID